MSLLILSAAFLSLQHPTSLHGCALARALGCIEAAIDSVGLSWLLRISACMHCISMYSGIRRVTKLCRIYVDVTCDEHRNKASSAWYGPLCTQNMWSPDPHLNRACNNSPALGHRQQFEARLSLLHACLFIAIIMHVFSDFLVRYCVCKWVGGYWSDAVLMRAMASFGNCDCSSQTFRKQLHSRQSDAKKRCKSMKKYLSL